MLSTIAEHIKLHRHELGQTALFVGSGIVFPPRDQRLDDILAEIGMGVAGDRLAALAPERQGPEAVELWAREVTDHAQRCQMLRDYLKDSRPAEGHIRLARLIKDGYFPTVFVADPSRLLEQALAVHHLEPEKDYHHFVAGLDDIDAIAVGLRDSTRLVIVKCGGDIESKVLPLAKRELQNVYDSLGPVIREAFRPFSIIVSHTDRDQRFLRQVGREGGKIFWVNRMVPMRDERLFDELKVENPGSIEYHRYQPEVMSLLEARHSGRHLLCREQGTFNEFFGKLHSRLARRSSRPHDKRRKDLTVLRGGPYRFLDYFDASDEDFFYGRDEDVDALLELLRNHPLSVLFGKSGIGKTSLLRAGLLSAIQHEAENADTPAESWLAVTVRCEDDPSASIKAAFVTAIEEIGFDPASLPADGSLVEYLRAARELVGRRLAILLDQFEEYFVHLGPAMQESFLSDLTQCITELEDVHWLLAIREDYVGHLHDLQPRIPEVMHHLYRLHRLTREQAEDAIFKPAQAFDINIERSLVERVLNDLMRDGVEPAQLQIVCDRLYQGKPRGMYTITNSVYDRLGGAQKILKEFLDQMLTQLPAADRRLGKAILKQMVAASEVRVTRPLERIAADLTEDREEVEKVLARLVDLRLVRGVGKERQRQYELIHEYLTDEIAGWLSREEIQVQDVQDLLTRQLNNYEKFGLLMHADELRVLGDARDALSISPEELELILRSAATEQIDTEYWFSRLSELGGREVSLLQQLLEHPEAHVRLTAATAAERGSNRLLIGHLVAALDDADDKVVEQASETLRSMERDLISELGAGPGGSRAMAARALGRLGLKRGLRPLQMALEDGDDLLRDEVTEALVRLAETRTHELLLRRLLGPESLPWAGAFALGHLGAQDDVHTALLTAAEQHPELAKLQYALGVASAERRDFDTAAERLQEADRIALTQQGHQIIAASLEDVDLMRQRAAQAVTAWPMFHRGPDHCGFTQTEVTPPLRAMWTFATKGPIMGSPVVADGTVYIGSRDGNLYAVEAKRGSELWRLRTGDRIESTAAVGQGLVFVGCLDGKVCAASVDDGHRVWQRDIKAPIRSSCTLAGERLFVGNRAGQLTALAAATGEILWQAQTRAELSSIPAVAGGAVVVGSWDGSIYAYTASEGELLWERPTNAPVASSPAIANGVVYCGSDDGHIYALALETGDIYWRVPFNSQVRSSPAVTQDRLVVGCVDGRILAVSIADGDPFWTAQSAEEVLASPIIAGKVVYVGSKDGALYALNLDTGEQLWRQQTSYGVYSSPAIAENVVYVCLDYYDLVALTPVE